jgi:hypothetical protein
LRSLTLTGAVHFSLIGGSYCGCARHYAVTPPRRAVVDGAALGELFLTPLRPGHHHLHHTINPALTAASPDGPPNRQRLSAGSNITNSKSPTSAHKVHSGVSPITEPVPARPRSRNGRP